MKKGITVEFDMREECYWVQKAKGTLTLEEIQQALNEYHGEDVYCIMMDTNNSYYDEQGTWVDVAPKGDCVKVFTYDAVKRMFEGVRK